MSDRSTLVPVVLAVVGAVALLAAPALLLQPHYGQAAYDFGVERVEEVPANAEPVAFEDLPSGAQEAFLRGASSDGRATLWVEDLDANATVSALRAAGYVKYDGGTYAVARVDVDRFDLGPAVGRVLAVLSVTLLTVAGLMAYAESDRPLTPLRALWVPLAPVLVTAAIAAYDVYVAPPKSADLPILLAASAWVVPGVYLRRRAFGFAAAASVGAFVVDALLTRPDGAVAVAGIVAYGVPWALLGATLAAPAVDRDAGADPGSGTGTGTDPSADAAEDATRDRDAGGGKRPAP